MKRAGTGRIGRVRTTGERGQRRQQKQRESEESEENRKNENSGEHKKSENSRTRTDPPEQDRRFRKKRHAGPKQLAVGQNLQESRLRAATAEHRQHAESPVYARPRPTRESLGRYISAGTMYLTSSQPPPTSHTYRSNESTKGLAPAFLNFSILVDRKSVV